MKVSQSTILQKELSSNIDVIPQDAKTTHQYISQKATLQFSKKYSDEPQKFWNKVLWTNETTINLHQSDGKSKVLRKKGSAHDPKHTS